MGPRKRILIELTPAGIDGAEIRFGKVVGATHLDLEPSDWREAWEEGLSPFDDAIASVVSALGAQGAIADVVYRSPTSFAELIQVPVTGGAVTGAAKLALADHVGYELVTNPFSIGAVATSVSKGMKTTYVMALADHARASETLGAWLSRAGLSLRNASPVSAHALLCAFNHASASRSGTTATLYLDRHCSALAVATDGAVRLFRRIEIGFEDFVSAMSKTIDRRGNDSGPVTLSAARARRLLCEFGVPEFDQTIDADTGLTGKDVLPFIQPALQRLAIEIKQSLRFELTSEERESIKIGFAGPFGAMPNLRNSIGELTEISTSDQPGAPLSVTAVEAPFLADGTRAPSLAGFVRSRSIVSCAIAASLKAESFRFGVRAGAAAAVVAMAGFAFFTNARISAERESTRDLGAAVETVNSIIAMNESIGMKSQTLAATHQRMGESIGLTTRWSDMLAALPSLIPDAVVLSEVEGAERSEKSPARLDIAGVARATQDETSQSSMNRFIEALKACPLVANVELGATNRVGGRQEGEAMRFSVVVNLVSTPSVAFASVDQEAAQ